jgi:hypothetical protein
VPRELEALPLANVLRDNGRTLLDRIGFGRPVVHRQAHLPDDLGRPANPCFHEQVVPFVIDLQDLG